MLRRRLRFGSVALALGLVLPACRRAEDAVVPSRTDIASEPSRVLPGKTYASREKVREGMSATDVENALGRPSERLESRGQEVSEKWTYLYADGRLMMNLRGGRVLKIDATFY